jgi:internalin A
MTCLRARLTLLLLPLLALSCGKPSEPPAKLPPPAPQTAAQPAPKPQDAAPAAPAAPKKTYWTDEMLHTEIKYHNPGYLGDGQFEIRNGEALALILKGCKIESLRFIEKLQPLMLDLSQTPITDLGPLRGKPIVELYLEDTLATDLSALRGMPLEKLYLSRTPARDLSALENMPLVELNVINSQVADISALATCKNLRMLWLTGCPVENISALSKPPLVSITLHRTKVKDLSPLSGTSLQRLHIGETAVTDLSPLKGMRLTRLVFTPANITQGLEVARSLPLQEIGTRFDDEQQDLAPPAEFWPKYDSANTPRPPLAPRPPAP